MRCAGERPLNPSRNRNTRHLVRALQAARDEARELRSERDFLRRLLDACVARNVEALGSTHRLIGRYLKAWRWRHKLLLADMASGSNMASSRLSAIESGRSEPVVLELMRLQEYMDRIEERRSSCGADKEQD